MRPPREDTKPWYKQFWPWFLISLPLSVVIASMYTINLAIQTNDGLVSDDYYKKGLAIHKDADSSAKAVSLGIAGNFSYDSDTGAVAFELDKEIGQKLTGVSLMVAHPTVANQDQSVRLTPLDGRRFSGRVEPLNPANWHVEVRSEDKSWRIKGRLPVPTDKPVRLD